MKVKVLKYMMPVLFFLIFYYWPNDVNKKAIIMEIRSEYKGVVIDSLYNHGPVYVVQAKNKIHKLTLMDSSFTANVNIGDTIIKFKNKNECLLLNKDKRINVSYVYNPKNYEVKK